MLARSTMPLERHHQDVTGRLETVMLCEVHMYILTRTLMKFDHYFKRNFRSSGVYVKQTSLSLPDIGKSARASRTEKRQFNFLHNIKATPPENYVAGSLRNPSFCKMPRHFTKCRHFAK